MSLITRNAKEYRSVTAQLMSQNLPIVSCSFRISCVLRHANHFVLAEANNRNVIIMYRSNRSFNMPPPPRQPPGHLTCLKIIIKIPPYPGQNAVQMPHTGVHSGDQMPPPRGHFTGTKMTEGRRNAFSCRTKSS